MTLIATYYSPDNETSVCKNVPLDVLPNLLTELRAVYPEYTFRSHYRGSRSNPADTRTRARRQRECLKAFATSATVYVRNMNPTRSWEI